ncbi:MAG TPA: zinc-dependent metalloprotease [Gemmatimonadaceae bacterium]|nr:zinc-dependent metalloprotease [Gemmatimonadaceae bacterium]
MKYGTALFALLMAGSLAAVPASAAPLPQQQADTGASARQPRQQGPRPYSKVITKRALTQNGLFTTHQVGDKLYYEIPRSALGKPMLLVSQIAKNTLGQGYGGQAAGNRVLRWQRQGDRILLRSVSYDITADTTAPIYMAVQDANFAPVIAAFPIAAYGPDSSAVIDVTRLYTTDSPEFAVSTRLHGKLDSKRSFVERVADFPKNIEVEATQTYEVTPQQANGRGGRRPAPPPRGRRGARGPHTASILMHWSMVKLPEKPMTPRRFDKRVGFFNISKENYSTDEHRVAEQSYITRWRLECPPGQHTPCTPEKPIVYYIDPATPMQWRPWIKKAIEDWQPAFLGAGFKHAIIAKDPPSKAEDPNWSPEDARYSVIRWLPSTIENAMGPNIHDPRTGEILDADISVYHNVMKLAQDWYFSQVGPDDPRAKTLPLPDSLEGRLLEYVVAHEVGHTLGLQHDMKGSSLYPADSLRSLSFLKRMGHTPSIMDYARFDYLVQPQDHIPPELLIPRIGPYDRFAIKWGYTPIPTVYSASTSASDQELPTLDKWALVQNTKPYLRFTVDDAGRADPGQETEAVGDEKAIQSTKLGIMNLKRLVPMLIPATVKPGHDYDDLKGMYGQLITQWRTELGHVAAIVGGVQSTEKYGGQPGVRFTPISAERQREAVAYLNSAAFQTPTWFLDKDILRRIEVDGVIEQIGRVQSGLLRRLLADTARAERMVEFASLANQGEQVYTLSDLFGDVRTGVWSELSDGSVKIDAFRRNLQRSYLDVADSVVNATESNQDAAALMRSNLQTLDTAITTALPHAGDEITTAHLQAARVRIGRILDPQKE